MKKLEEWIDEVSKRTGYDNWSLMRQFIQRNLSEQKLREAAELYAQSIREHYEVKLKEKESQLFAVHRFRVEDAASAMDEANELREKIKDLELIIYGLEEGSSQWESLARDREKELKEKDAEIERLKGQIEQLYRP